MKRRGYFYVLLSLTGGRGEPASYMPLGKGPDSSAGLPAGSDCADEGHGLAQDADIGGLLALVDHGIVFHVVFPP